MPERRLYQDDVAAYNKKQYEDHEDFFRKARAAHESQAHLIQLGRRAPFTPGELQANQDYLNEDFRTSRQRMQEASSGKTLPSDVLGDLYGRRTADIELPKEKDAAVRARVMAKLTGAK